MLLNRHRRAREHALTTSADVTPSEPAKGPYDDLDGPALTAELEARGLDVPKSLTARRDALVANDAETPAEDAGE